MVAEMLAGGHQSHSTGGRHYQISDLIFWASARIINIELLECFDKQFPGKSSSCKKPGKHISQITNSLPEYFVRIFNQLNICLVLMDKGTLTTPRFWPGKIELEPIKGLK